MHGSESQPKPDVYAAVTFFRWLRSGGPRVVTAIDPDNDGVPKTFTINDDELLRTFVRARNLKGGDVCYANNSDRSPATSHPLSETTPDWSRCAKHLPTAFGMKTERDCRFKALPEGACR
jgi:hypothetical protein